MKTLIIASLLAGSVLFAAKGYNMPSFSDFDANANGKITQTEFENAQQSRMQKHAEDGRLMRNAPSAPVFKDVDSDANGYIDKSEFANHQRQQRIQ